LCKERRVIAEIYIQNLHKGFLKWVLVVLEYTERARQTGSQYVSNKVNPSESNESSQKIVTFWILYNYPFESSCSHISHLEVLQQAKIELTLQLLARERRIPAVVRKTGPPVTSALGIGESKEILGSVIAALTVNHRLLKPLKGLTVALIAVD